MDENHGNIDEHNGQEICWLQNAANKQANRKEKWPYLLVKEGAVRSYGDRNIPYSMLNTGATNGVSPHDRYRQYRGIVGNPLPPIIWKALYIYIYIIYIVYVVYCRSIHFLDTYWGVEHDWGMGAAWFTDQNGQQIRALP